MSGIRPCINMAQCTLHITIMHLAKMQTHFCFENIQLLFHSVHTQTNQTIVSKFLYSVYRCEWVMYTFRASYIHLN